MALAPIENLSKKGKRYDYVFILPRIEKGRPSGGYNIVYQLSSRLCRDGFQVSIMYLSSSDFFLFRELHEEDMLPRVKVLRKILLLSKKLDYPVIRFLEKIILIYNKIIWRSSGEDYNFSIVDKVHKYLLPYKSIDLVNGRMIIATSWRTSFAVDHLSKVNSGDKNGHCIYLIQNSEDDLNFNPRFYKYAKETYDLKSLKKVVLNKGLFTRFAEDNPFMMNIGIDNEMFKLTCRIEDRVSRRILIPLRSNPSKGAQVGLDALKILHNEVKGIEMYAFGDLNPKEVPDYINYSYKPSNQELVILYNMSSIFILPSVVEGMPAPPLEAMRCGNAVVVTDNGGSNQYIINGKNGIVVPNMDSLAIARNAKILISDNEKRIELAKRGYETASSYSYDAMYREFKQFTQSLE
jgi:glycosyltransferase involved in cell wall biosynthesis